MQTINVGAEHLTAGLVEQQLHQPIALQLGQGLGVGLEVATHHPQLEALLGRQRLGIGLAQAHRADLGVGEGGGRNRAVVDAAGVAQDVLHRHGALGGGGVGEHHLAGHIANGPQVRDRGGAGFAGGQHLQGVVHRDEAAVGRHAHRGQIQIFAHRHPAGGHQHRVHLQRFHRLAGLHVHQLDLHRAAGLDRLGQHAGTGVDVAAVDQVAGGDLGDVGIEGGHHPIEGLDHRDLTAQGRVDIGEFQADIAAAHDRDPTRQPLQVHRLIAGEHGAAIGFNPWWHERIGAGGDDHVAGAVGALHPAAAFAHHHPLGPIEAALAPQDLGAGALHGLGEVGADRFHQLAGVIGDLLALEAHRRRVDAETGQVLGVGQLPHPAAGGQQGLGGHTAPVHAGAAHVPRFDNGDPQTMLSSMLGGIETAVAGPDHDQIEIERASRRGGGSIRGGAGCDHRTAFRD